MYLRHNLVSAVSITNPMGAYPCVICQYFFHDICFICILCIKCLKNKKKILKVYQQSEFQDVIGIIWWGLIIYTN